jgi:dCTP deaminase
LTGPELLRGWARGDISIEPFDERFIEPNSYGFHLGDRLITYADAVVDSYQERKTTEVRIPETGFVLRAGEFYLGSTLERMGSIRYAAELYARFSTGAAGLFIQTSAPLGHTGAILPWTLEMVPTRDIRIYPGMLIGKICFWTNKGTINSYNGRYKDSTTVVRSLLTSGEP